MSKTLAELRALRMFGANLINAAQDLAARCEASPDAAADVELAGQLATLTEMVRAHVAYLDTLRLTLPASVH